MSNPIIKAEGTVFLYFLKIPEVIKKLTSVAGCEQTQSANPDFNEQTSGQTEPQNDEPPALYFLQFDYKRA